MTKNASAKKSEVDVLWDNLPSVFEIKSLPPNWDDEWIAIPLDSPESTAFENSPDKEIFVETLVPIEMDSAPFNFRERLPEQLTGPSPGAFQKTWSSPYPPPDAFAFYLPFHYFYPQWWGIYLLAHGVEELGKILYQNAERELPETDCRTAARIFLFGHEQYHHSVESFATRLEITHRLPTYKTEFESFYKRTRNSPGWLEEALANANGYRRAKKAFNKNPIQKPILAAVSEYIKKCGPGYNRGMEYVTNSKFEKGQILLAEAGHKESSLKTPDADPELWTAFAHSFHPFRKKGSHVIYLVHRSQRAGLKGRYLRYRDVKKRLEHFGCAFVSAGKGSHEKWQGLKNKNFSVPRHPGDLKKGTLHTILKQAGIPVGLEEFLQGGYA